MVMTLADIVLLLFFPMLMAFAAASDLLTMTISNWIALLLTAGFIVLGVCVGASATEVLIHLAAGALVLTLGFALFSFGWIGGGDAKFASATAVWIGFGTLADYTLIASLLGGVLTLFILIVRRYPLPRLAHRWTWALRLHDDRSGVPYGIALACAGLVVFPQTYLWQTVASL